MARRWPHSLGLLLLLALSLMASAVQAQVWKAQDILSATNTSRVRLTARQDSQQVTADIIERAWVERAMSVVQRLAPAYGMQVPTVIVTYDKSPNAFVTANKQGDPIMGLNTEMLRLTGDDENMLAAVIGHELGHLKARHLSEGSAKQGIVTFLGVLAGLAIDVSQVRRGVDTQGLATQLGALGSDLVNAKFNRDQEREADELGIQAMARAGFDPSAVPQLWRKMSTSSGSGAGLWLDSHPSHAERERAMQVAAAALTPTSPAAPILATAQYASIDLPAIADPWPRSQYSSLALTAQEQVAEIPSHFRRGLEAFKAGRQDEALAAWHQAVETDGDERAMAYIGDAYMVGRGVPKDSAKAYEYFQRSASKGLTVAIHMLGEMAAQGSGNRQEPLEARNMFILAHHRGFTRSSARLGLMYLAGTANVSRDVPKGLQLAQWAAERNDPLGKSVYGAMLRDGTGITADPARAFVLLKEGADALPTNGYANYQLAVTYERGLGVTTDKDAAIAGYRRALAAGVTLARDKLKALGASETP